MEEPTEREQPGRVGEKYNHTITGESFGELIYPEFKGYHGNLFWAVLETEESPITVISETPNLYFQLFKPDRPKHVAGGSFPDFPEGISLSYTRSRLSELSSSKRINSVLTR